METYQAIRDSGLLSRRRWQVYYVLYMYGPMTGGEVFRAYQDTFGINAPTNSNVTTRLGELRESGVVKELGTKICDVSGQNVILWATTDNLPKKLVKEDRVKRIAWAGYNFSFSDKIFWITKNDGEGMGYTPEQFDKWFKENI